MTEVSEQQRYEDERERMRRQEDAALEQARLDNDQRMREWEHSVDSDLFQRLQVNIANQREAQDRQIENYRNNRDHAAARSDVGWSRRKDSHNAWLELEENRRANLKAWDEHLMRLAEISKQWAETDVAWSKALWERMKNRIRWRTYMDKRKERKQILAAVKKRTRLANRVSTLLRGERLDVGKFRDALNACRQLKMPPGKREIEYVECWDCLKSGADHTGSAPNCMVALNAGYQPKPNTDAYESFRLAIQEIEERERAQLSAMKAERQVLDAAMEAMAA